MHGENLHRGEQVRLGVNTTVPGTGSALSACALVSLSCVLGALATTMSGSRDDLKKKLRQQRTTGKELKVVP